MPSYTIYGNADDYLIVSAVLSGGSWPDVREGTGTATLNAFTGATDNDVGASANSGFQAREGFFHFDTSAVVGTVTAASLNVTVLSIVGSGQANLEAMDKTWTTANTSSWTAGSALSQHYGPAAFTSTGVKSLPRGTPATLPISSSAGIVLFDQRQRVNTTPLNADRSRIYWSEQAGTTNDPYLSVTTVTPRPYSFGMIIG